MGVDGVLPRTITEIVVDRANTNENRAAECLRILDLLPADDLARDDYRCAAQTFALLALVDRIGYTAQGYGLADAVLAAGGVFK